MQKYWRWTEFNMGTHSFHFIHPTRATQRHSPGGIIDTAQAWEDFVDLGTGLPSYYRWTRASLLEATLFGEPIDD